MAKEVELKKIELRVSANCCEGCKRKVKKALRGVEGVLKAEIDPLQPKMTVLGNVNPQILIKKLLKVGKRAELSSYEELKAEKKEAETVAVTKEKEKEKENNGCKEEKQRDTIEKKTEKSKDVTESGDGEKNKDSKKDNKEASMTANAFSNPQDMKKENPPLPLHPRVDFKEANMAANASSNPQDMKKENLPLPPRPEVAFTIHPDMDFRVHPMIHPYSNIKTNPQYCYMAQPQPCAVAAPRYAIPSYPAPPLYPTRVEEYYHFDKPNYHYQPPFLRPTDRVGDYFSDDNAVGCHVM